ncbi:IclR family transcriptional regulator [Salicibibacter cibarius]|uniref:Glycerol operon regulatory protein n=1 Tax=Salicibibacter cibarius TaxID=2743000 RepID=A0A7T6Z057_9BACI|nr:IclR family transcriptional regulator [Salicibibacter cibarius]QQK74454.1 IclR family transcriptional regulator [Salicibibacter cibarius]
MSEKKYSANSLARGLEIITLFNEETPTLSLAEIAKKLGVSRNVPYRLLYVLQSIGYVEQDESTKRYNLTPKVLELGFSYMNSMEFPKIAQPYLEGLRDELGATCHLSILDGQDVVYVGTAVVRGVSTINVDIGMRLPARSTANGRLLMAFTDPYSEYTKGLEKEIETIREQGYAITEGDFHPSISSVAVPIFYRTGQIMAAINVVVTDTDFPVGFINDVALPKALEVVKTLSNYTGYQEQISINK